MQYSRILLSMKYTVPVLTKKRCMHCGNIKLWKYIPLLYTVKWPDTRSIHSTTTALATTSVTGNAPTVSIFRRLLRKIKFFDIDASRAHTIGCLTYENIVDKLDYSVFYKDFNMPDTFFSWFLVTQLHIWMMMVRYMAEGKYGKIARNALVEMMWNDVNTRTKLLGRIAASIRTKEVMELSYQFNAAVIAYDEGLMSDDKVLAGVLWATLLRLEGNDPEAIEKLVIYVRKQIDLLDRIPSQTILRTAEVQFIQLKDINIHRISV